MNVQIDALRLADFTVPGAVFDAEQAFAELYAELRNIARRERRRNPCGTVNTTALVHEAWMKISARDQQCKNEQHYLATAAMAMRQILVDYARYRHANKRTAPEPEHDWFYHGQQQSTIEEILAIDQALNRLQDIDSRLVRLVELRFFAGLSIEETANCLDISARTAARDWNKARAYLQAELSG
ncbi:MAG: ECF-type sigma factor [Wenzhouxiangellaceae bacterium]